MTIIANPIGNTNPQIKACNPAREGNRLKHPPPTFSSNNPATDNSQPPIIYIQ
jgi:hypothetical protein